MDLSGIGGSNIASSQAIESQKSLVEDFDAFLSILTTQLQNQDPLEPTDSSEFTSQLVSFAGVEQQIQSNRNLEELATEVRQSRTSNAVNFLGNEALVPGRTAQFNGVGGDPVNWQYGFEPSDQYEQPTFARLTVFGANGSEVLTAIQPVEPGINRFDWDGLTNSEAIALPGQFTLSVVGLNANAQPLTVAQFDANGEEAGLVEVEPLIFVQDEVTAVDITGGEPLITVGLNRVTESDILRFIADREPTTPPPAPPTDQPTDQSETTT